MNKTQKLRIIIVASVAVIVAAVLFIVFAFFPPFAYLDGEFYSTSGTEELNVSVSRSGWPVYYLQFFRNLKHLHLSEPREQDLKYIPDTPALNDLAFAFNEIDDMPAVKAFNSAEYLHFLESHLNFADFSSDSISDLSIWSSYIKNFDKIGQFPKLEHLELFNCSINSTDEYSSDPMTGNTDWKLEDSSPLAGLDNVKTLVIERITVTDISGILDMRSLEELQTYSGCFSAKDIDALRDAGINVVLKDTQQ